MSLIPVNLATEDELSEIVLSTVIARLNRYAVGVAYRRGGFGYLRRTVHGWNRAAKGVPFIVLTDLDQCVCPAQLIQTWLPIPQHPNLVFRVAVREVEAWLLADRENFAQYLAVSAKSIPEDSDSLDDPKATLIGLARQGRSREIRERVVPRIGSTAKQGPDYNGCLGLFVREKWDIGAATKGSPSLARTVHRLTTFQPVWP